MTFFDWLCEQTTRTDAVGVFAKFAKKDKFFPRPPKPTSPHPVSLGVFLQRYEGLTEQREGCKIAHAEWRKLRKQQKSAQGLEGVA